MYKALDIARYFVAMEPEKYTDKLVERNGHKFYEGNARINKYLQLAQNIYAAKNGDLLLEDMLIAYSNGAIVYDVMIQYKKIISDKTKHRFFFNDGDKKFLDKFVYMFRNSSIDDLIELSHEDEAWVDARKKAESGGSQAMHQTNFLKTYKQQYNNASVVMDRMCIED